MSAESLKFFESKSETDIINWMLVNLTTEQIKMCIEGKFGPSSGVAPPGGVVPPRGPMPPLPIEEEAESAEAIRQVEAAIEEESELEGLPSLEDDKGAGPGVDLFAGLSLSELDDSSLQPLMIPKLPPPSGDVIEAESLVAALAATQLEPLPPPLPPPPPPPLVNLFNPDESKVFDTLIGIQQKLASIVTDKPILSRFFKIPPLFIYKVSDIDGQTTVNYYKLNVDTPGRAVFEPDSLIWSGGGGRTGVGLSAPGLKARWKRYLTELETALSTPEWAPLLSRIPKEIESEIRSKPELRVIKEKYGPGSQTRISQESIRDDDYSYFGKLVNQTDEFLDRYGTNKFGVDFMSSHRPHRATNKFGVKTLQWVKS